MRGQLKALMLATLLAGGCGPKPGSSPPPTDPTQPPKPGEPEAAAPAASPEAADSEGKFKQDAMQAMVRLTALWTLLGIDKSKVEKPTSWHRHTASGTCMPRASRSWTTRDEHLYGPGDESVSLWNEEQKTLVTLYTYPATKPIDGEFESVLSDMSRTCTEGPMMSTTIGAIHVGGCVRRLDNDVLLLEQVMVFQHGQWMHKARITFAALTVNGAYPIATSAFGNSFATCK